MRIHSRAIVYFDMVRRCGSVRQASRRLNVSASAVNRQLLYLESEVGAPLFERLPNGMKLTPAGEVLARHSITVIQDAQRTASEFDNLRGIRRGKVTLITAEGVNSDFLPTVIERMLHLHPMVEIEATTAGSHAIPAVVLSGDADIGLAFSLPRNENLQQRAVGRFRIGAVVQPNHPLTKERRITFAACARYPLILGTAPLSIHTLMEPLLRRHKAPLKTIAQTSSIELMKSLALRGLGVAFQTTFGLEAELRDGLLVHLPLNDPAPLVSELGAYVRAGRPLPSAVDAFLNMLSDNLTKRRANDS
ncbi:MAG TPA: LysR family transcriptional regulator [Xanthobacteraceae bacterium]|jgi:DNA-binding transcriptional LysR family regulator|nr:LysR family transcriptional regulator [Xanthobacteraceae bacterium]